MRVAGTVFFGLLFTVGFVVFFLFHSITSFPLETRAVVDTLRAADVRTAALDTLEAMLRKEIEDRPDDPVFAEFALGQARAQLEAVITDEWFYDTVAAAHQGMTDFVARGEDTVRIDLGDTKDRLTSLLFEAGRHGVEMCDAVGGGRECRSAARDFQRTLRRYRGQIDEAMDQVPDVVNLTWLLSLGGAGTDSIEQSPRLQDARRALQQLALARWFGLATLVVMLGLIALINKRSLQRMLVNVGLVAALAGATYLAIVPAGSSWAVGRLDEELAAERAAAEERGDPSFAQAAGIRVVAEMVERIAKRATVPVTVVLLAGLGMVAGGVVLHVVRRRRQRPAPATVPPPPPFPGPMPPGYYPPASQ
jgi:cell division protein FtsB